MKYFTKSKFKMALECPTKLYYDSKPEVYANAKLDDPFLKALAEGGFQVGALAKCYYPHGIEVVGLNKEKALAQTNELLKRDKVVIFEAAVMFENFFIRIDILEKDGKDLKLIEVKSKSATPEDFKNDVWKVAPLKKGQYEMKGDLKSYLYDVAFQSHVTKLAFPDMNVESFLMCADKTKLATVDGLNQKFRIKENNEVSIIGDVSKNSLGKEVLTAFDISSIVQIIHDNLEISERFEGRGWHDGVKYLAQQYIDGVKLSSPVDSHCKKCQFRCDDNGLKSGFNECWNLAHGLDSEDLLKPFVFDVWNFRGSSKLLQANKVLMEDIEDSDISVKEGGEGLNNSQRQCLQIDKYKNRDDTSYIDLKGLEREFSNFKYPLHMIDFETCMVAIPFNKGRRPYEQMAFQFSHHIVQEDGTSFHADEFINNVPGIFPNFIFIRALKKALEKDQGTIFRYSNHENTVLKQIKEQLINSTESDKDELCLFIESITDDAPRTMIDLCELVKKYYYSPSTKGSNSIKYVLPAVLNESEYIQEKYSQPTYNSSNFRNHQWINFKEGKVLDPYKTLPPIFDKYDYELLEKKFSKSDGEIANGGAALISYAIMQFTEMTDLERKKITEALLRYCELDTLAMVMLFEFWKSKINEKQTLNKAI